VNEALIPRHPRRTRAIEFLRGPIPVSVAFTGWWVAIGLIILGAHFSSAALKTLAHVLGLVSLVCVIVLLGVVSEGRQNEQPKDNR
jgi:hypothetical protein